MSTAARLNGWQVQGGGTEGIQYSGFVRMLFFDHATMHLIIGPMCNIQICHVIRELRARNITCDSSRDVYFFSSL